MVDWLIFGNIGDYAIIARRKGTTWYVGATDNWSAREVTVDLSFLGKGGFNAEIFSNGMNAHGDATDFKKSSQRVTRSYRMNVMLAPGGGRVAMFSAVN